MKEQVGLSQSGVLIAGDGPSFQQALAHPDDHSRMQELFKKHRVKQQSPYGKRIYVSRASRRKLENEKDIFGKLEKLGFSFLPDQHRSVSEQIAIFSDAEIVAGPHGAGLCNAVWGSSLVSIIEAKSSAWDFRSFQNWCAMRGAPYRVLFDRGAGEPLRLNVDQSNNDLKISPDNFYKAAESINSL
jgi:capsular polysaccharide biosynthesis protein